MNEIDLLEKDDNIFHKGEVFAQETLGLASTIAKHTQGFIRPYMPDQHRDFFESHPLIMIGLLDQFGYPVVLPVWGHGDFVHSPSKTRLTINLAPTLIDLIDTKLQLEFQCGSKFGLVGVELTSRRRNRLNGVVAHRDNEVFQLNVEQSFGNCPQYIHKRKTSVNLQTINSKTISAMQVARSNTLTNEMKGILRQCDTFYIASRHNRLGSNAKEGIDVSHRGGKAGFIHVDGNTLLIPDFSGNKFFNTLGNIQLDSRIGICIIDDATGALYLFKGDAEVLWDISCFPFYEGAERFIRVKVTHICVVRNTYPFRYQISEHSKSIERTGTW